MNTAINYAAVILPLHVELYEVSLVKRCNQNSSTGTFCPLPKWWEEEGKGMKERATVYLCLRWGERERNVFADIEMQH